MTPHCRKLSASEGKRKKRGKYARDIDERGKIYWYTAKEK
jgi:hypothetical protein